MNKVHNTPIDQTNLKGLKMINVIEALQNGTLGAKQQNKLAQYLKRFASFRERNNSSNRDDSYVNVEILFENLSRMSELMGMAEEEKMNVEKLYKVVFEATSFKVPFDRVTLINGVSYMHENGESWVSTEKDGWQVCMKSGANYKKVKNAVREWMNENLAEYYRLTCDDEEHELFIRER